MLLSKIKNTLGRTGYFTIAVVYMTTLMVGASFMLHSSTTEAASLTNRSLTLSSSANGNTAVGTAGSGTNGAQATYTFGFKPGSATAIGSVVMILCDDSPLPSTTCAGNDGTQGGLEPSTTAVASATSTLAGTWSLDTTTTNTTLNSAITGYGTCGGTGGSATHNNCIAIKASAATAQSTSTAYTITVPLVKNPTNDNTTFYARLVTFGTASYGTAVDNGAMAASTSSQVVITAKVQEALNFSVMGNGTPSAPLTPSAASGTSCPALTGGGAAFLGDSVQGVLNSTTAYDSHSWFRVSTNASNGTLIYYSGDTLKSGSNSITSVGLTNSGSSTGGTASSPGSSQFGLAIDTGDSAYSFGSLAPNNASNISGHTYNYASGSGTITSGGTAKFQYDTASVTTPRPIAITSGIINCDTGSVRYLGNISATTPPGVYTTNISYIAVPTY